VGTIPYGCRKVGPSLRRLGGTDALVNMEVDVELQEDLLLAIVSGTLSFDAALSVWKKVLETAGEHQVKRILVDAAAVGGTLSITERYRLATELSPLAAQDATIAVVGESSTLEAFALIVAQNLGRLVMMFPTRPQALRWLDAAASP
jgi:hypothetical protein